MTDLLAAFSGRYDFALDPFQRAGCDALRAGRSVLVAAPTGAGKTVVGEFATFAALQHGRKCFYTTPIKALSNQKYADLVRAYGADQVGLLTGDNAVNGEAPVVVMTTEVLRNMLYERSPTLTGLESVVLDEVHYLGDRERGAVWEEVMIQLPAAVQLACLSATVSNAEEFGAWIDELRDGCDVVVSEHRPVPLEHHYAIGDRLHSMFRAGGKQSGSAPSGQQVAAARQARGGRPNPEVLMLERRAGQSHRVTRRGRRVRTGPRLRPPRRSDLVRQLAARRWLPAIYFLFSRNGCDDAVAQLVGDGVRLTSPEERAAIRRLVDERTADLPADDLAVLGYGPWAAGLELGIAAHHAGLVPAFKETVEELFVRGLVKVAFATETLALGINMPARTVVIERLEKWNGQRHELLTPGQFTQLTGRAGRRGLDPVGHAVVAYQRDVEFPVVAGLVARRVEPLRSSFTPSYNMACNLLALHSRAQAEALLKRSFAQFQVEATVAGHNQEIARNRAALEGYADRLVSERGDFGEYWALRRELSRLESEGARTRKARRARAVEDALTDLRPGDVIELPDHRRRRRLAAVVSRTQSRAGTPLAAVVTSDREHVRIGPREFDRPPRSVGWVALPPEGGPRQPAYRKQVEQALHQVEVRAAEDGDDTAPTAPDAAQRIAALRAAVRAHPVHTDPELAEVEVWAHRHDDLRAATESLERGVRRTTRSLVRTFDRIIGVLSRIGYLDDTPAPTAEGRRLAGLYADTDLVLAECLRWGAFDGLSVPETAALASLFTYQSRAAEPGEPWLPTQALAAAGAEVQATWRRVVALEDEAALPATREPDAGIADIVHRWAAGAELDDALGTEDLSAGDFVRNAKQVADLLRQIRASTTGDLAERSAAAARAVHRGVVAFGGV